MTRGRHRRKPRFQPIARLNFFVGLSNFGSGLVYPYTAIFLVSRTPLGASGAALFFAVLSLVNFLAGLGISALRMSSGPGLIGGIGSTLAAVSYASVAFVHGEPAMLAAAVGIGLGRAAATAGNAPLIRALAPPEQTRAAFGRWYRAMNIGLGLGTLAGSLLTATFSSPVLAPLFIVNGVSFVPLATFLVRHRHAGRSRATPGDRADRLSFLSLVRSAATVTGVQFAVYLFAYSQLEATTPLVANKLMGQGLSFVALVIAVNTVALVALQKPVTRLLAGGTPRMGVRVAVALWVTGYGIAAVASLLPGPAPVAGLLLLGVVFASGEAAYSCSYQPWLLGSVPEDEATRTASLSNAMRGVGASAGPSLGVLLIATGRAVYLWTALAGCCAVLGMAVGRIGPRPQEQA
ncbi:MAG TPA: MFS transporter [Streptosporangiaceae bacterium]|nr:MFS transporter [Streptosporangiaceae bacterium]